MVQDKATRSITSRRTWPPVWIRARNDRAQYAMLFQKPARAPKSYIIATPEGEQIRTRYHLIKQSPVMTCSCSGVTLRPLDRLKLLYGRGDVV